MSTSSGAPTGTGSEPSASPSKKTYSGGCHCGIFAFECRHPAVEDGAEVLSCNCSICVQRGYLFINIMDPEKDFTLIKGRLEDLTKYTFNKGVFAHLFCPVCGCGVLVEAYNAIGVNLRAVQDVDLDRLTLKKHDGRAS